MSAVVNIQSYYRCERCKAASDIYGRSQSAGGFILSAVKLTGL